MTEKSETIDRDRRDDAAGRPAHGGRYRGHPDFALRDGLRPPAPAHGRKVRRREIRPVQTPVKPVGLLPRQKHLRGRPRLHRQGRADGNRIAQANRSLGGCHAHPLIALAAEKLGGFARVVAQRGQNRAGGGEEAVLAGCRGQLAEPRAEDETPLHVAGNQAVVLERDGEAVDGRPRQMRRGHQLRERLGSGFEGAENGCGLVEHSDAGAVVS